jgi:hypothetical protein
MKKIILLIIIALGLNACSFNDEKNLSYVLLPIENVIMPDAYTVGDIAPITIKYRKPTTCHLFYGFYYDFNQSTRTVAVRAVKTNKNNCTDDSENPYEATLNFKPLAAGIYTFKFWNGTDINGEDQFLIYEAEVP